MTPPADATPAPDAPPVRPTRGASVRQGSNQTATGRYSATEADHPTTHTPESTPYTMADNNPTVVATPYPTYIQGGDADGDSEVFKAALIAQGDASTQRNQDAQFASLQSQLVHRDVRDGSRETAQAKYDLAVQGKDAEIRNSDRFSAVTAELAAIRAKMDADQISALRVELAETKADGRQAKTESLLAAILAKLPV